jgi:hypothetical protein
MRLVHRQKWIIEKKSGQQHTSKNLPPRVRIAPDYWIENPHLLERLHFHLNLTVASGQEDAWPAVAKLLNFLIVRREGSSPGER